MFLQIRGTGLLIGTEFTDNKSPNNPFPLQWGKFFLSYSFYLFIIYYYYFFTFINFTLHRYVVRSVWFLLLFFEFNVFLSLYFQEQKKKKN